MKKLILLSFNLLIISTLSFGQSSTILPASSSISRLLVYDVSGFTPDPSAALEVRPSSTTNAKGFRLPNLTTGQITGITSPAQGLLVAESQPGGTIEYYTGFQWSKVFVLSPQQSSILTYSHLVNSSNDALHISNYGTGSALSGSNISTAANVYGVYGDISSSSGGALAAGVYGKNNTTNGNGAGIIGEHVGLGIGVLGKSNGGGIGVSGQANGATSKGVYGSTDNGKAMHGLATAPNGYGIYGEATANGGYGIYGKANDGFSVYGSTATGYGGYFTSSGVGQALYTSGSVQFQNNGEALGRVLTSDANGAADWQDLPKIAFTAYANASYVVPINTIQIATFSLTEFNVGNNYSTVTNKFTAPKTGVYHIDFRLWAIVASSCYHKISIYNASNVLQSNYVNSINPLSTTTYQNYSMSVDVKMNSTDYAVIEIQTFGGGTVTVGPGAGKTSTFSGHYVCGL